MDNQVFSLDIDKLKARIQSPLPGLVAHQLMDPLSAGQRKWNYQGIEPRSSAVMILLYLDDGHWKFPLIQRPVYEGSHSGQVALPGGKRDETDFDLVHTATRETFEEIGVKQAEISILGSLTAIYVPPSNFNIQPILGWMNEKPNFIPDQHEVAHIYSVSLTDLVNPELITKKSIPVAQQTRILAPCFEFGNVVVWGATAMILSELSAILNDIKP